MAVSFNSIKSRAAGCCLLLSAARVKASERGDGGEEGKGGQ